MSQMTERFELTTDPVQQAKLRRKLEEYKGRVRAKESDADAACKAFVLAALLEHGSIDPVLICEALMHPPAMYSSHVVANAIKVIEAYNAADTSILRGGQGLS